MFKVISQISKLSRNSRSVHELAFSFYLSLLILWVNAQTARDPWSLQLATTPLRTPDSFLDPKLTRATALLWVVSATIVFLCVKPIAKLSFGKNLLRSFIGITAVSGFPLADLYVRWSPARIVNLLIISAAAAYVLVILVSAFRKWSSPWTIPLIFLYFGLCGLRALGTGPGLQLLWPGYEFVPFAKFHPDLIYPFLGLCCTISWAAYISRSSTSGRPAEP